MGIDDLQAALVTQHAYAEVPGFYTVENIGSQWAHCHEDHPVPRIGWTKCDVKRNPPRGWHVTSNPTTPSIYLGAVCYLDRDQ